MLNVTIQVDATKVVGWIDGASKQMPFAVATALNRTGTDVNAALRREIPKHFIVRDPRVPSYVAPYILPKTDQATKRNLSVIIGTEGKGRLLAPFETGTPKVAASPDAAVAVPTSALRPTARAVVPRKLYPINLGFVARRDPSGRHYYALGRGSLAKKLTPYRTTATGATQVKGRLRTFILDPRFSPTLRLNQWGVYQRFGPKRGDIRMLWQLRWQVRRPPILAFLETTQATVDEVWRPNMLIAWDYAIRTAF